MKNEEIIHPLYTSRHLPGSENINPNWSYVPPVRPGFLLNLDREETTSNPIVDVEIANKLRQNEFPIQSSNRYPSKLIEKKLSEEIANHIDLMPENVLMGNGIMSLMTYIYEVYTRLGDFITVPTPSFWPAYSYAMQRGRGIYMPQYKKIFDSNLLSHAFEFPLSDLIKYLELGSPLCYLCNPNNPTGTMISYDVIEKLVRGFPKTLFVLDEAYGEFAANKINSKHYELTEGITLIKKRLRNVIVARTFSKAYALANHRVGYLISDESNIENLRSYMGPYDINELSLALALYNYRESNYVYQIIEKVTQNMVHFTELLSRYDVSYFDSFRNSLLVEGLDIAEKYEKNHIAVRSMVYQEGIPNIIKSTFRITIPSDLESYNFLTRLTEKILTKQ